MNGKKKDPIREHQRLREESEKIRADSIRTRVSALDVFCDLAESQVKGQSPEKAQATLAIARDRVAEIDFHLRERGHVSRAAADELGDRLVEIRARIQHIEQAVEPESGKPVP